MTRLFSVMPAPVVASCSDVPWSPVATNLLTRPGCTPRQARERVVGEATTTERPEPGVGRPTRSPRTTRSGRDSQYGQGLFGCKCRARGERSRAGALTTPTAPVDPKTSFVIAACSRSRMDTHRATFMSERPLQVRVRAGPHADARSRAVHVSRPPSEDVQPSAPRTPRASRTCRA
jgi:hypothetical protein